MGASGHALLEIHTTLQKRDFEIGYYLTRKMLSPLHLPRVQAGLCLTGAALCASMIPTYLRYLGGLFLPLCGIGVFLFLAGLCAWGIPSLIKSRGGWIYITNRTLSLSYTMSIFEDRFLWENQYEQGLAYWTDVQRCYEDRRYYVLTGDLEKPLFVIPKESLTGQENDELGKFLRRKLAVRYRGG